MGASTIDKDKEMLKSMKSISTLLEKFIVSVTGTNGTGTVSGTNTSSRSNKAESDKALDKIEKNIRNQLLKGKLADWEIQQRRETFIGKVMENKIIRPFYLTFKSLQGHTANLFRDLRGAWSDVYGKVFKIGKGINGDYPSKRKNCRCGIKILNSNELADYGVTNE